MKNSSCIFVVLPSLVLIAGCNFSGKGFKATSLDEYDKQYIVDNYHSNIDSNLSIFPDQISSSIISGEYYAYMSDELFDDTPEVYLKCSYNEDEYTNEINRLSNISITISYKDEEFVNNIKYDESLYYYPAYIANDGFASKYEYALMMEESHTIVYMYLSYPSDKQFDKYPQYIKQNKSDYDVKNTLECFTIYNHSFDGGQSYIEFDD